MAKREILNNDAVTLRVGESVTDILDEASNLTEQTLDLLENQTDRVIEVTRNNPWLIAGALVVGLGVGGFIAYRVAVKRTSLRYEDILEEEILAAKEFYKRTNKAGEFETPESAAKALVPNEVVEAMTSYQGRDAKVPYNDPDKVKDPRPPVQGNVQRNVFTESVSDPRDWDYNAEVAVREENPDVPYVVSFDEFHENPDGNEQATLAYYAADDTLCDERDAPIDNTDYTVGDDNLTRFGHGSGDNKVVYIRNDKLSMDFEVVRSEGSFAKEVLNLDPPDETLRHSSRRHPNRPHARRRREIDE